MTDARGSQARWSAAALLAPTAAAVFTGATAWTLHHSPTPTAASAPATTQSAPPRADPGVVAMRSSVKVNAAKAARLQQTLATLRRQAALRALAARGVTAGTPTTGAPAGSVAAGLSSVTTVPAQTSPVTGGQPAPANPATQAYTPPVAAPAQPVTPAPAAPPPPVAQPVPVAAPPVHTTTGASAVVVK